MQSQPIDNTHHDDEDRQAFPKEGRDPEPVNLIGALAIDLVEGACIDTNSFNLDNSHRCTNSTMSQNDQIIGNELMKRGDDNMVNMAVGDVGVMMNGAATYEDSGMVELSELRGSNVDNTHRCANSTMIQNDNSDRSREKEMSLMTF